MKLSIGANNDKQQVNEVLGLVAEGNPFSNRQ